MSPQRLDDERIVALLMRLEAKIDSVAEKLADRSERLQGVEVHVDAFKVTEQRVRANTETLSSIAAQLEKINVTLKHIESGAETARRDAERVRFQDQQRLAEHSSQLDHLMREAAQRAGDEIGARRTFALVWTVATGVASAVATLSALWATGGLG